MKMSDKSTTKAMFASLYANYEGSKKVREAKALMFVHRYELFKMKDDESIEQMYSRFQTLVSGLQIPKKNCVASDHVNKILRSLPARCRPKVTAIEEVKDINTLSVKDLVTSLKVHEIGLNEHEPAKKNKSSALPSKWKSSIPLKVIESEEESPDEDSDEDPTENMAMLSNKLEYMARKNRKFLSKATKAPRMNIRRDASTVRSLDISLLIALIFRRRNQRTSQRNQVSTKENSGSRLRRV